MATYEAPILENNEKIEEQIKLLQEQLKPIHIPIVKKYLPFPYEVNVIILDYLEIEKKKHIYWISLNKFIKKYISNNLGRYYLGIRYWNTPKNKKSTAYECDLDYRIRKKQVINTFKPNCELLEGHTLTFLDCNKEFDTIKNYGKNKVKNLKERLINLMKKLEDIDNKTLHLRNFEYVRLGNCYGEGDIGCSCCQYRIFGNKGRINPIPYKKFLKQMKDMVSEEVDIITNDLKLDSKGYYGK